MVPAIESPTTAIVIGSWVRAREVVVVGRGAVVVRGDETPDSFASSPAAVGLASRFAPNTTTADTASPATTTLCKARFDTLAETVLPPSHAGLLPALRPCHGYVTRAAERGEMHESASACHIGADLRERPHRRCTNVP
jgi:hypothetical protein